MKILEGYFAFPSLRTTLGAMTQDRVLAALRTEAVDQRFANIDTMSISELLAAMNASDAEVPEAIAKSLTIIEKSITAIVARMHQGGRLIYMGAGTSGRLGVLDAAECGPTFSVHDDQVMAFIAGGEKALKSPVEGAEDDPAAAVAELNKITLQPKDIVVGIAASGRTPYVYGALEHAKKVGALAISLSCNPGSEISKVSDFAIEIDSGPELLAGSTRLKSGTAQKLVLNMISTISMIQLGKTFGNLMVDLQITNVKLQDRAIRIIQAATECDRESAEKALSDSDNQVKVAIVMLLLGLDPEKARQRLVNSQNRVREAIK